jgi:4-hydroxy-3-polyprenylbenzoate decarboxylase
MPPFAGLRDFATTLERQGELVRVTAPVDPHLEISELVQRVVRQGGPALLFENVQGATFPLLMNTFGSLRRIELALGRHPQEIGDELVRTIQGLTPPSPRKLWEHRGFLARARHMRPAMTRQAPVQQVIAEPRLDLLPAITSWPRDGGPFITFGPTLTEDPRTHKRNYGLYRLQVYDRRTTGMHWQSMKGGRAHHWEAERLGQDLPAAVVLGGDPLLMLAAIMPLPEDMDELTFVGLIRGAPTRFTRGHGIPLLVPADAEFVIEGHVAHGERRTEGPFGDHFGHYSEAQQFPVFHATHMTHRVGAIYPASVVGKPPQEDKFMGLAVGEMIGPLIKVVNPNIVDLSANDAAGFHNLLVAACKERHPKEVLKTALSLLGTGQLALTKMVVLLREDANVRDFSAMLRELWYRWEPRERFILLPIGALDTLDYTSFKFHVGAKAIFDAAGEPVTSEAPPTAVYDPAGFDRRVGKHKLLDGGFLVVQVAEQAREVLEGLVRWDGLGPVKFVVAVSGDVDLDDEENLIWGIWTRFDPALDFVFATQHFEGARPVYGGRMGINATWKEGYPLPLTMPDEVVQLVDRRWGEYFPAGTPG